MNHSIKIKKNSKTKTQKIFHKGGVNWPPGLRRKIELKNQEKREENAKNQPLKPIEPVGSNNEAIMTIEEDLPIEPKPKANDEFIMTIEEEEEEEPVISDIGSDTEEPETKGLSYFSDTEDEEEEEQQDEQQDEQPDEQQNECNEYEISYVGIGDDNFSNNCYLNVVFQLFFHMCFLRKELIEYKTEIAQNNPNYQLANILNQYEALAQEGGFQNLLLTINDYDQIKALAGVTPEVDSQSDPTEVLTQLIDKMSEKNPDNGFQLSSYTYPLLFGIENNPITPGVYSLVNDGKRDTNIQEMIQRQSDQFVFDNSTTQRYLILSANRNSNDGKLENIINANPQIKIKNFYFKLKGIIAHFGTGNAGHYIYVTYSLKGGTIKIDKIYNDNVVIKINENKTIKYNELQNGKYITAFTEMMDGLKDVDGWTEEQITKIDTIRDNTIQKNYLKGVTSPTQIEDMVKTFKTLVKSNPNFVLDELDFFKVLATNTKKRFLLNEIYTGLDPEYQELTDRNGVIFLYEFDYEDEAEDQDQYDADQEEKEDIYGDDEEHKEDIYGDDEEQEEKQPEPPIKSQVIPAKPVTVVTPVLSDDDKLDQLTRAKRMAFRLFNLKERIVDTKQIKVKYDKLIQIVEKNTPENINKKELIQMITGIYDFTKIMVQMLLDVKVDVNQSLILDTQTFATHKDFINKLFDTYLLYETQFLEYKNLSVNDSTIKLVPPKIDRSTRKYADRMKMCKDVSQMFMTSINNKNIEMYSELPKLTKQTKTRKNRKGQEETKTGGKKRTTKL
jgi:hypothetical protein